MVIVGVYSVGFVVVGLEDGSQVGGSKAMGYKLGFLAPLLLLPPYNFLFTTSLCICVWV